MKHENWVADNESKLESQKMIIFLTCEFRMRNTSYRELWENVSLTRWAGNIMQMKYAGDLLLNCFSSLLKISCFKGLN